MIIKIVPTQKKFARPFTGMLFTFVMTFIISTPVKAEIYRVVDAEGKVTFTDQPPPTVII